MNRSQKLFTDWLSAQPQKKRKEIVESLKIKKGVFAFKDLIEEMGDDGKTLKNIFLESNLSEDSKTAKELFCKSLVEATEMKEFKSEIADYIRGGLNDEGYEHYAVLTANGIGNNIDGDIEVTQNGLIVDIIRAIVGGNMAIAAQLTAAGWASLSSSDKMTIYNTSLVHSGYNQSKVVAKENGEAKYYVKQMKKEVEEGSIKKEDFIKKAFPRTDISLLKI